VKVVVSAQALADLDRLKDFLADKNLAAARRMTAALIEAIGSLDRLPARGRPGDTAVRELIVPFGRAAYVVRYAHFPKGSEIVILRIWHGREMR
jgi:plasmid stabilization system protein ParE